MENPASLLQELARHFERAAESAGTECRHYSIAGEIITLEFAGAALVPALTPALDHLRCGRDTDAPQLRIRIFDGAPVSAFLAAFQARWWLTNEYLSRGPFHCSSDGEYLAIYNDDAQSLSMLHWSSRCAYHAVLNGAAVPTYERGAPLREILNSWFGAQGRCILHGAVVGMPEAGGVMLAGKGGSGKSTTSLLCLSSGMSYVSDDHSLVSLKPVPTAHALYNSGKLKPDMAGKLARLKSEHGEHLVDLVEGKHLLFTNRVYPSRMVSGLELRAILIPRVTGERDTRLLPATGSAGMRALAPSTLSQRPSAFEATFGFMANLARALPCYHLELGTEMERIPRLLTEFLQSRGAAMGVSA